MVKIICAGLPKTGTKSLTAALHTLGYGKVFDYLEHIDMFMNDYASFFNGKKSLSKILDKYEEQGVECVVDMPPSFLFEEFYKRWPDAKVILTVRDEDAWYVSIKKMNDAIMSDYYWMTYLSQVSKKFDIFMRQLYQYMFGCGLEKSWLWRIHYRRHNAYVEKVIPPENLLILDVSEGWKPLCDFLHVDIPEDEFPFVNAAGSKGNIIEKLITTTNIAKQAKYEIIMRLIFIVLFCSVLLFALFTYF